MTWTSIVCMVGLILGVIMGLAMLIRPRQSHLSIGLASSPEKSGGIGEQRAFGAFLIGLHGYTLWTLWPGTLAPAAPMVMLLSFAWLLTTLARIASVLIDREGIPLNLRLIALDAFMTLTISAPLLMFGLASYASG